jgi:HEAT repeat protein
VNRHSKQVVFVIFSTLIVGVSEHLTSSSVQASQTFNKHLIFLQATQSSPISQATPSFSSSSNKLLKLEPQQAIEWIKQQPFLGGITTAILLYLGVLGLCPTWLLVLPLDKIPKTGITPEIPIPPAIGSFLKYRPRVLDAWVSQRIAQAQDTFENRPTVQDRRVHIPIPVEMNGNKLTIANFSASDLKGIFSRRGTRILIVGEGGVGKTSLACQIAKWAMAENKNERLCKHRMLPILIEEELESVDGKSPLLEAIAHQIKNLRDDEKPVSEELLKQLLEKRRILVIVDHLSEMSETTRKATRLRDPSSPVNALIITSRTEDILGKEVTYAAIKPQRVSGKQLSIFMDAYLTQRGKRDLFDDLEYLDALRRLLQIVAHERDVTALFAKLYADQMIAVAEGLVAEDLPDNVPDLMLNYINEVNRERDGKIDDHIIQRDLKIIAWECLKQTFQPETAEREHFINYLAALEGEGKAAKECAKKRLNYLEERLALIRTVPPTKNKIRFALDPLAEYLAGLYLVELYGADEKAWQAFLCEVRNKPGTIEELRGFLLAVRDCCIARATEAEILNFVSEELGALADLDLEALQHEQFKRRVHLLISELVAPEPEYRARAARDLGRFGTVPQKAIPALIRALRDGDESVRSEVISALGLLASQAKSAIPILIELLKFETRNNSYIRLQVIFALGKIALGEKTVFHELAQMLIKVLQNEDEDREVHFIVFWAFSNLGLKTQTFDQIFLESLQSDDQLIRLGSTWAVGKTESTSKEISQALVELFENRNEDERIRSCAAWAIGKIHPNEPRIVQSLIQAVDDEREQYKIRYSASWALGKFGLIAKSAIPTLTKVLKEQDNMDIGHARAATIISDRSRHSYEIERQESLFVLQEIDRHPTDELQGSNNELWQAAEISLQLISQKLNQSNDKNTKY